MPDAPRTVFVTNVSPDHKYESLAQYGAMRPVTSGNYPIFKTQRLIEEIVAVLVDSEPDDYLALSGSAFVAALCLAVWMILHRRVNVLLFDPRQARYVPRVIKREELVLQIEKERGKDEQ